MSLFEKWSGTITLPKIEISQEKIGGNFIHHLALSEIKIEAKIYDSQYKGFDLLKTGLSKPYDQILIRIKGSKKDAPLNYLWLTHDENYDLKKISEKTKFSWENIEPIKIINEPEKIVASWHEKFRFKEENEKKDTQGLRAPQIGALHAISAHFAVGEKHDAATVVLPTGTGKTETMLSSLVYNQRSKLLVLVPSDALRAQIFDKFCSLGFLPLIDVVPLDIARPRVAYIKKGIKSDGEAKKLLENSNVIIATPHILHASNKKAFKALCAGCSDLFIDEAHHGKASTWVAITNEFKEKRVTQFTATPYRNDGKHIGGRIIFNYKLGDAQKAGYYQPIRLNTIEEYGAEEVRDKRIADAAIQILREDIKKGYHHLMMARVDSKVKAEKLHELYLKLAPDLKPIVVYTGSGRKTINQKHLEDLKSGKSKIVICVNMLGEGFDLPHLKIAAIHDGHKSLVPTLQFIGRFTRKAKDVGEAAAIINIGDEQAERNIQKLYAEGADWDDLLKRFSEDKIEKEKKLEEIVSSLKERGDLHDQISLWNLDPSLTTQIYITSCQEWYPEKYAIALPKRMEHWHSISESKKILIVLGLHETPVKWGEHQDLNDINYKLLIAYWNKAENALFVYSNDYDGLRTKHLVDTITKNSAVQLSGNKVFNILNNVELPLVKSLGASKIGAISFTSYFGPNVTDGLAEIEKRESELNNIACLGYEDGERVIWAATKRKGKIWAVRSGTVYEWLEWCDRTWSKVSNESLDEVNIVRDFLKPEKIKKPYSEPAISIQWGEHVQSKYSDQVSIFFGKDEAPLYLTNIELLNVGDNYPLEISISSDSNESIYEFTIDSSKVPGYSYKLKSGKSVYFKYGKKGEARPFEEHVVSDPFIIRYSDGTYSYNNYHIPLDLNAGSLSKDVIEVWDWKDIALNEESMGKTGKTNTIQHKAFKEIEDEYDFIFNDDGKGEAADLVAIKNIDDKTIGLCLVHCKNAYKGKASGDIRNLYEVCGQSQKSIRVKHEGLFKLSLNLKRRHETWNKDGFSRLLKGDLKTLTYFRDKARKSKIQFEVIIVQPGLSKAAASTSILKLLATTELYLKKTTEANFRIIGSP